QSRRMVYGHPASPARQNDLKLPLLAAGAVVILVVAMVPILTSRRDPDSVVHSNGPIKTADTIRPPAPASFNEAPKVASNTAAAAATPLKAPPKSDPEHQAKPDYDKLSLETPEPSVLPPKDLATNERVSDTVSESAADQGNKKPIEKLS